MSTPGRPTRRVLAGGLIAVAATAAAQPASIEATVEQPRAFGHVLGDVLTQRVLLQHEGQAFEPAALPAPGRVGAWLERRAPRIATLPDGRRWLSVDYQLINAPRTPRVVTLPAWELKGLHGAPALAIGPWPLSVAPLVTPGPVGQAGLPDLLPERPAPTIATQPIRRQVMLWTTASVLALAAWTAWVLLRNRRTADLPFARAWRELAAMDPHAPEAWQTVHRAFDRTAGLVVHGAALPLLFQRAPHFEPLRPEIENFYAQSRALFFGESGAPSAPALRTLCARLRRLEMRHET